MEGHVQKTRRRWSAENVDQYGLVDWRDAYEGPSHRAGSSHLHKSGPVSNRLECALVARTDTHSRNSGSRSPRDAEVKAGRSNRREKHTTRTLDANLRVDIISEGM